MSEQNGGPAFPTTPDSVLDMVSVDDPVSVVSGGMSLRDYFAAQALTGAIRHCTYMKSFETNVLPWPPAAVELAYQIADEMLKHRSQP